MAGLDLTRRIALRGGEQLTRFTAIQILRRAAMRSGLGLPPLRYGATHHLDGQAIRAGDLRLLHNDPAALAANLGLRDKTAPATVSLEDVLRTASTSEAIKLLGFATVAKPEDHDRLEPEIKRIGAVLFGAMIEDRTANPGGKIAQLRQQLMAKVMFSPRFQRALFAFVEAFPVFKTAEDKINFLKLCFKGINESDIPDEQMRKGLAAARGRAGSWLPTVVAFGITQSMELFAKSYIIAETIKDAVGEFVGLYKRGIAVTADLLGEKTFSIQEGIAKAQKYITLINAILTKFEVLIRAQAHRAGLTPEVSVKLSALTHVFSPVDWEGTYGAVEKNLSDIFRTAKANEVRVTIDMESYKVKDLTLDIVKRVLMKDEFKGWEGAGIVIQAYLKDAEKDINETLAWAEARGVKISIRLVKGAYHDLERLWAKQEGRACPVFENKFETDANYERLIAKLMANHRFVRPAFASMNARTLATVIAYANAYHVPLDAFEVQLLFGMNDHLAEGVLNKSHELFPAAIQPLTVRFYTPLGNLLEGMAYFIRRIIENVSQASFLRMAFMEAKDQEVLLQDPFDLMANSSPAAIADEHRTHDAEGRPLLQATPPLQWFRKETHAEFEAAKAAVRAAYGGFDGSVRQGALIGGHEVEAVASTSFNCVNPSNKSEVIARVTAATEEIAKQALTTAVELQKAWDESGAANRAQKLRAVAAEMLSRRLFFTALISFELGKAPDQADKDLCEAIDFLNEYANQIEYFGDYEVTQNFAGEKNYLKYVGRGTALVISPWNFFAIPVGMIASELAGGNSVVFKPSERALASGRAIADLFNQFGLPVQYVPGGKELGKYLVRQPEINSIRLTGSVGAARDIEKAIASRPAGQKGTVDFSYETGGKDPIVAAKTADQDVLLAELIESFLGYQGQKCSACSRFIFVGNKKEYDAFMAKLVAAAASVKIGLADKPGTVVGPVIDEAAKQSIEGFVDRAKKAGARVQLDRKVEEENPALAAQGFFVGPKILDNVRPDSELAQAEIFGPVLAVFRVESIDEAIDLANNTPFGLTAAFFSRDEEEVEQAIRGIGAGNLYINKRCTGALVRIQPFGVGKGTTNSGTGGAVKPGSWGYVQRTRGAVTVSVNLVTGAGNVTD